MCRCFKELPEPAVHVLRPWCGGPATKKEKAPKVKNHTQAKGKAKAKASGKAKAKVPVKAATAMKKPAQATTFTKKAPYPGLPKKAAAHIIVNDHKVYTDLNRRCWRCLAIGERVDKAYSFKDAATASSSWSRMMKDIFA